MTIHSFTHPKHGTIALTEEAVLAVLVKAESSKSPTQWAYDQACTALHKHKARADALEQELTDVKAGIPARDAEIASLNSMMESIGAGGVTAGFLPVPRADLLMAMDDLLQSGREYSAGLLKKVITAAPVSAEPVAWAFNRPSHPYKFFTTNPEGDNLKREKLVPLYAAPATTTGETSRLTPLQGLVGTLLTQLDHALSLDKSPTAWVHKPAGTQQERMAAWAKVNATRREINRFLP